MTPANETAFTTNAGPTPATAISAPASAGPTARARLNSIPFNADAAARSALGTSSGRMARHVGVSSASPAEIANVKASSSHGVIAPANVNTASSAAMATIQAWVNRISLRRSTMSPMDPAGSASRKKGSEDAVCVRATYKGPAPKDTISQAAPTLCMKVPMSETTSAMRRLRNVGTRTRDHKLRDDSSDLSPGLARTRCASALIDCLHRGPWAAEE